MWHSHRLRLLLKCGSASSAERGSCRERMIKLDGIHIDGSYYRRIQTRAQSKILKFLSPRTEGLYSLIRAALISMQPVHAHAIYSCRLQLTVAVLTLDAFEMVQCINLHPSDSTSASLRQRALQVRHVHRGGDQRCRLCKSNCPYFLPLLKSLAPPVSLGL